MPSVRKVERNCCWVFGFFTTIRQLTSQLVHNKLFTTVFLQLNQPAHSPDVARNNCYLFTNRKSRLRGPGWQTLRCKDTVDEPWFERQDILFIFNGLSSSPEKNL